MSTSNISIVFDMFFPIRIKSGRLQFQQIKAKNEIPLNCMKIGEY